MLNFLRKGSSSFTVKLLLGLIALSFVIFFGFSGSQGGPPQGATAPAAKVNQESIPFGLFVTQIESFASNGPESKEQRERQEQLVLQSLLKNELFSQAASAAGIFVSDTALSKKIKETYSQEGKFDYETYHNTIHPKLTQRFGIDLEDLFREEIQVQRFTEALQQAAFVSENEVQDFLKLSNAQVSLKIVEFNLVPGKLTEAAARKLAQKWIELKKQNQDVAAFLEENKIKENDFGSMPVFGLQFLWGGKKALPLFKCLFALKDGEVCSAPHKVNENKIIAFQLVSRETKESSKDEMEQTKKILLQRRGDDLAMKSFELLKAGANIQILIPQ